MKEITKSLETYLNTERNLMSCDLYRLVLLNGTEYRYADTDKDVTYNGKTYKHDSLVMTRKQIEQDSEVSVDSLTVDVYADSGDLVSSRPFIKSAHDGVLDRARLYLTRAFFDRNGVIIGTIDLFGGNIEVKKAGGIHVELEVKSDTQGLNMDFPIRKYYPRGQYVVSNDTIISSTDTDKTTLVAPFIPLKEVLL